MPTNLEAKLFCNTLGKLIWVFFQPLFYIIRPLVVNPKKPIPLEFVNTVIQVSFDVGVVYFFGNFYKLHFPKLNHVAKTFK